MCDVGYSGDMNGTLECDATGSWTNRAEACQGKVIHLCMLLFYHFEFKGNIGVDPIFPM